MLSDVQELEYLEDLEDAITTGSDVHRCKSDLCLQCKAGNQSNHVQFVSVSDDVNTSPCVLPKVRFVKLIIQMLQCT